MSNETLISALIRAQQKIDHVVQDSSNPFFESGYASLRAVFDAVKGPLNEEGIYIQQISHENDSGIAVETVFMGYGGTVSTGKVYIPAVKSDPQAFGSALSYAKRYSLSMACGIASKLEDDDAEVAMKVYRGYPFINLKGNKISYHVDAHLYLVELRKMLKDPEDKEHQTLYRLNKVEIKKAQKSLDDKDKDYDAYEQLITFYEG